MIRLYLAPVGLPIHRDTTLSPLPLSYWMGEPHPLFRLDGEVPPLPGEARLLREQQSRTGRELAGFALEREGLCPPPPILSEKNGKPCLPPETGLFLSLAHSGGLVLCALSDCPIGCDLELHRPRRDLLSLAERYFSPAEAAALRSAADPTTLFLRLWTAKEAFVKCTGEGLKGLRSARLPADPSDPHRDGYSFLAADGDIFHLALCRLCRRSF